MSHKRGFCKIIPLSARAIITISRVFRSMKRISATKEDRDLTYKNGFSFSPDIINWAIRSRGLQTIGNGQKRNEIIFCASYTLSNRIKVPRFKEE